MAYSRFDGPPYLPPHIARRRIINLAQPDALVCTICKASTADQAMVDYYGFAMKHAACVLRPAAEVDNLAERYLELAAR